MADNFGLFVSAKGTDVNSSSSKQMLLNAKYPQMKIDRGNGVSFSNVQIHILTQPPTPAPTSSNPPVYTTLLYKFAHGYTYTPQIWCMCQAQGVQGSLFTGSTTYFNDFGCISGNDVSAGTPYATISTGVDSTYAYVYVNVYTGIVGPAVSLVNVLLNLRFFIFVDNV